MNQHYAQLIDAANEYIRIQSGYGGRISVVGFSSSAQEIYRLGTRSLGPREGYTGGGTNFTAALQTAIPLVGATPSGFETRILFFTDGCPNNSSYIPVATQLGRMGVRIDSVGFGSANRTHLQNLLQNGGRMTIGQILNRMSFATRKGMDSWETE
jgi:uncharacterized protein YegL